MTGTGAAPGTDPTSDHEPTRDAASTSTTPDPAPSPDPVSAPPADGGWAPLTAGPTPPEATPTTAQPPTGEAPPSGPAATPLGPPPPGGWQTPPPPAHRNHTVLIAAGTACLVLVMACFGLAGGLVLLRKTTHTASGPNDRAASSPTTGGGLSAADRPSASPTTDPGPSAEPTLGPEASAYGPTEVRDLNRMCDDNVYYPQSPKRAGKAPHPVVVLVDDGSGLRHQDSGYYYSEGLSDRVERTWAAQEPGKVQMVACLDRVSAGSTIRQCRFDDPKPDTLPLVRAGWRLRVYEVATGRTLLDKAMPGDDRACPYVVMLFGERKIYAEVSDKALLAALRKLVTK
ncbi:hypothetical protein ACFOOK_06650 [Micromonospora krabiensis]|uniref:Uncharacterized protein n=1 Tax=Micromonospora krabiensis TaxID=307121 RepID=A0A1C3NCL3_9ACTN|nr:hypothetical protein [Micromonospora krabiensis]SBV30323.1 hypothetical protein GA0070620_5919 [Micromonospora krabiensis]